jgi:hypothetical protein
VKLERAVSGSEGVGAFRSGATLGRVDAVDLFWIPLGAGGHSVAVNGRAFEAIEAVVQHRERRALYHAALVAHLGGEPYAIERAPSPDADERGRGVVGTGPVGSRALGRWRLFRYEVRCWRGGAIPDLAYAIGGPTRLTNEPDTVRGIVALVGRAPTPVWGRDELRAGEMWNSNSMVSWVIATAGLPAGALHPPTGGRAPGWDAGLVVARRGSAT